MQRFTLSVEGVSEEERRQIEEELRATLNTISDLRRNSPDLPPLWNLPIHESHFQEHNEDQEPYQEEELHPEAIAVRNARSSEDLQIIKERTGHLFGEYLTQGFLENSSEIFRPFLGDLCLSRLLIEKEAWPLAKMLVNTMEIDARCVYDAYDAVDFITSSGYAEEAMDTLIRRMRGEGNDTHEGEDDVPLDKWLSIAIVSKKRALEDATGEYWFLDEPGRYTEFDDDSHLRSCSCEVCFRNEHLRTGVPIPILKEAVRIAVDGDVESFAEALEMARDGINRQISPQAL